MASGPSRLPFRFALLIAFASGAAALAHEVIWTRRLVDILGASAETFSRVVGTFFLGLALGAAIASRKRWGERSGWLAVGAAELTVGLLGIPLLFSPSWSEPLYAQEGLVPWLRILLPILLVAPPAAAMGLVLPWMIDAVARTGERSPNLAVWIYAANTIGGIVGVTGMMLAPVPRLGLTGTGLFVCGVNFVIAASVVVYGLRSGVCKTDAPQAESEPGRHEAGPYKSSESEPAKPAIRATRWLAFASGFLVLSLEVVLQHQLAQVSVNSQWAGSTVLGLVLLALAIAALLLPLVVRLLGEAGALRFALLATFVVCATQPFLFLGIRKGLAALSYDLTAGAYASELLKVGFLAACPMLVVAGMIFPLLLRGPGGDHGRRVGELLALNGFGGWVGAEGTQLWLAPQFGLWVTVEVLAGGYLLVWLILQLRDARAWRGLGVAVLGAVVLFFCIVGARRLPQAGIVGNERLAGIQLGREGVVATMEFGPGDWRVLLNNDYTLGGSRAQPSQERQALVPLLLHGLPGTVATLGVATGSTVAGAAAFPGVERIDAIELSPLVLESAKEFFTPYNRGVFRDPRVNFIVEDARWVMARKRATYDVVIGDLFLPWRTGEGRLFTREHFENVQQALKPGGIFCQWLPLFQLTQPQFEVIVRTFRTVFPDAFLVRANFYVGEPTVALVGGIDPAAIDWMKVASAAEKLRGAGGVTDPLMRHAEGVAMLMLGRAPDPGPGPINTLANCWLEWDAARNVLGPVAPWFNGAPWVNYARTVRTAGRASLPGPVQASNDAGGFFFEMEVADELGDPAYRTMVRQMPERLPPALVQDRGADWAHWPNRRMIASPVAR